MIVGLLAPSSQRALLEGQVATTPEQLLGGKLPLAWRDQLRLFNM